MSELPDGWAIAALGEMVVNRDNQRVPVTAKERSTRQGTVPYYGAAGQVGWIDSALYDEQLLLLGEDGVQFFDAGKSKAYVVDGLSWVNNHAHVLSRIASGPSLPYLKYFLDQFDYRGYANGTTRLKLTRSAMDTIPVRLAPLAEQERIVMAIDEAFSKLDAAEAGLRTVCLRMMRMRDAVLSAALTGRLVPQDPTDTPATEFLAKLGVEPCAPEGVPDLPPTWAWATLGSIADVVGGVTKDGKRQDDPASVEARYLRVANVQRGFLDLEHVSTIRVPPAKAAHLALVPGDVLFNEGGDRDKLGRGWIWEGQVPGCIHQNHVFRARLAEGIEPKLVSFWGNTFGKGWFEWRGKQTTNLASLNLTTLKSFPVPIAPPEEQVLIVAEVDRQLSFLDACERSVDACLGRSSGLRRSVLSSAFQGRLAPQDSTDEPASALLERIRTERAAGDESGGGRRRKRVGAL